MRLKFLPLALAAGLAGAVPQVDAGETAASRPVLPVFSSASDVSTFCDKNLAASQAAIDRFAAISPADAEKPATLDLWDDLSLVLEDLGGPIAITSATATEKAVREAAETCELKVSELQTRLFQNVNVFERMRAVRPDGALAARLKSVTLEGFEDAGVSLSPEARQRSKEIFDKLAALGIEFERNTRENLATVPMALSDLEGLPKSYIDRHKADDKGLVNLSLNYPDYVPFMDNAVSAEARRRYFVAFNNIGGQRNLDILNEQSRLRKELAGLFGKPSYADYVLARRMAGAQAKVNAFLDSVKTRLTEVEKRDIEALRAAKAKMLGRSPEEVTLNRWDTSFYSERVRRDQYAIDQEALRKHFPTEASIAWLFDLAQRMYGVRFVRAEVPVWHSDVRYYDIVNAKGVRIAGAYMDPFPRDGKYNHAAVWPVRGSAQRIDRTPISVLVTNLNRQGLNHDELETLLHEFGHLLHGTLSKTRYASLAGTSVRRDFVEAPSQMFEEWARNAGSLALIRTHCKECPGVTKDMVEKLNAANRFAKGIHYSGQHLAATVDQAITSSNPPDVMEAWSRLQAGTPLGFVAGTITPARWGHFANHYSAGYYGYMWSEVLALDMASAWGNNLLDKKVSQRYLDTVLSRGGEREESAMVRDFLGREPSSEPFFRQITGAVRGAKAGKP